MNKRGKVSSEWCKRRSETIWEFSKVMLVGIVIVADMVIAGSIFSNTPPGWLTLESMRMLLLSVAERRGIVVNEGSSISFGRRFVVL